MVPEPAEPSRSSAAREWLLDVLLTIAAVALAEGQTFHGGTDLGGRPAWLAAAIAVAAGLPVLVRRRLPLTVLVVTSGALVAHNVLINADPRVEGVGCIIAVYTVAVVWPRRRSIIAASVVAAAVALTLFAAVIDSQPDAAVNLVISVLLVGAAWGVGDNVATRRAYLAGVDERMRQERAGALAEQRSAIARELHDVVSHHVAAIAVQSSAAQEVLDSNPEMARQALADIQATSRKAMDEMRAIVGVLDRQGPHERGSELAPQPRLGDLEGLAGPLRSAGIEVAIDVEGPIADLAESLQLSAYRIVQEALTNVMKHADAHHVGVHLRLTGDTLDVTVADDGSGRRAPVVPGSGRGLAGMRERAELFSGSLEAGPEEAGGFRVHAVLSTAARR